MRRSHFNILHNFLYFVYSMFSEVKFKVGKPGGDQNFDSVTNPNFQAPRKIKAP